MLRGSVGPEIGKISERELDLIITPERDLYRSSWKIGRPSRVARDLLETPFWLDRGQYDMQLKTRETGLYK
ncbi:hypothetical protein TNCV_1730851 [Trichonephila clavipes]|nr:hypothetical protein TNCV_1730851 [Trichonephila clavipes]